MLSQPQYALGFYKPEGIVELTWLPGTEQMDDEDFKAALEVFAEAALQHRPPRLIIDMREFRGRPSDKVLVFRDDVTVPKYERAGIKKLAWVWPGEDAGNTGTGAAYDQRYFASRDEAIAWTQARA